MPAGANRKKSKAAKARAKKRIKKHVFRSKIMSGLWSTANLKQKPVLLVQPEEEESSAQENSLYKDLEDKEKGSSSEEQEHNELDDDDNESDLHRVPFRIRIIPVKQKKTSQKAGRGMSFISTYGPFH